MRSTRLQLKVEFFLLVFLVVAMVAGSALAYAYGVATR